MKIIEITQVTLKSEADPIFVNHTLIINSSYSSCRRNKPLQSIKVLNSKIKMIHQLEKMIAKSKNKIKSLTI